jgi:hypothetical protein
MDRLKEIEVAAKDGKKGKPPRGMTMAEVFFYKIMCSVYAQLSCKAINVNEAKQQKQAALADYKTFALWEQIFLNHIEINNELEKLIEPVGIIDTFSKQELIEKFKKFQCVLCGFLGGNHED